MHIHTPTLFLLLILSLILFSTEAAKETKKKKNYYEKLAVTQEATIKEIKKAYAAYALKNHPDKDPHSTEEKKIAFQEVTKAYEVLSDPEKKERYDKHLQWGEVEYDEAKYENYAEKLYKETDDEKAERLQREAEQEKRRKEELQEAQEHSEFVIKSVFIGLLVGFLSILGFQYIRRKQEIKENQQAVVETKKRDKEKQVKADQKVRELQQKSEERSRKEIRKRGQKASNYQEQEWQKVEIDDSIYDNLYERTDTQTFPDSEDEAETETSKPENGSPQLDVTTQELEEQDEKIEPEKKPDPPKKKSSQAPKKKPVQEQAQPKAKPKPKQSVKCPACKKVFKTVPQWENHIQSKKHQQTFWSMKKQGLLTDADLPNPPTDFGDDQGNSDEDVESGDQQE